MATSDIYGRFDDSGKFKGLVSNDGETLPINIGQPDTPTWLAALGRVVGGTGQAIVALIGDSTTVGAGAGTGAKGADGARAGAASARLVQLLNGVGVPASDDSFFGEHLLQAFNGVNFATYETRFAPAGGASYYTDGSFQSLGGIPWRLNAAGHEVRFTPTNQVDSAKIIYFNRLGGSFDVTFAGGASLGITTGSGALSVGSVTKNFTKGSGQLAIKWSAGNNAIAGALLYDSTTPRVNVVNLGCYGDKLTTAMGYAKNTNEWRGGAALAALAPDLTIVDMTINSIQQDGTQGVAAYRDALAKVAEDVIAAGSDLMFALPNPINTTFQTDGTALAYYGAIFDVADAYGARVVDVFGRLGDWTKANNAGLFFDALHPSKAGYAAKAMCLANAVRVW